MLEVCVDSLQSALNAINGGADELEVCSSLPEGGLTPSAGLVREILKAVSSMPPPRPKVNVMLRCRPGCDFRFAATEMDTMLADLEIFKEMNVDRFVFGAIHHEHTSVDIENCKRVIAKADGIPVTFHRAFDVCIDPRTALEVLIDLGFNRILTSGQSHVAVLPEAVLVLKKLMKQANKRIEIMPGAGITEATVGELKDTGCRIYHGSCKVVLVKQLPKCLPMGANEKECIYVTDEDEVRRLKRAIAANDN